MRTEPIVHATGKRLWLAAGLVTVLVWPGVAFAAATITGTVTFDGKAPTLKPLAMDADPVCAKKHTTPQPNEMLVLGSGNTMGNILVWVSKGLPAGKTWPVPKTPVVIDQNGCIYKPHVMGIMVGQTYKILNSDGVLHNIHTLPTVNPAFNKGMPPTLKEATTVFEKPEEVFHVKCDVHPWMSAYVAVFIQSLLLGDGHGREVHDLGPRPWDLRDHRLAREAGDADGLGHCGRAATRRRRTSSSPSPRSSRNPESRRMSEQAAVAAHKAARRARSPSRAAGLLAHVRLLHGSQGHRHPVRRHGPAVPPLRLFADDAHALAARLPGRCVAA